MVGFSPQWYSLIWGYVLIFMKVLQLEQQLGSYGISTSSFWASSGGEEWGCLGSGVLDRREWTTGGWLWRWKWGSRTQSWGLVLPLAEWVPGGATGPGCSTRGNKYEGSKSYVTAWGSTSGSSQGEWWPWQRSTEWRLLFQKEKV